MLDALSSFTYKAPYKVCSRSSATRRHGNKGAYLNQGLPGSLVPQHPLQPGKEAGPSQHHPRDTHGGGVYGHSRPLRLLCRHHAFSEGGARLPHRWIVRPGTQQRGLRTRSTAMALGNRCLLPQQRQRLRPVALYGRGWVRHFAIVLEG